MTQKELFDAVMAAPEDERVDLAEKLLAEYDGPDKDVIGPSLYEMIALHDTTEVEI